MAPNADTSAVHGIPASAISTVVQRKVAGDQPGGKSHLRSIGPVELAQHKKKGDAWVAIRGKVYDVTEFAEVHPGGGVIYTYAGKDATDVFAAFHDASTWSMLPKLCIGEYREDEPPPELVRDFRELRVEMKRRRMFDSSVLFYVYKFTTTLLLLAASIALVSWQPNSVLSVILSGLVLGLFWQQSGWLAHDFLHHQVFRDRRLNDLVGGYLMGNVAQGFSVSWWKNKHNTHHAAPNECDSHYKAVDPDIDTLPLLAWSEEILGTVDSKALRKLLRWQRELFLPILLFARFAWLHASWTYAFSSQVKLEKRPAERIGLLLHYLWLFTAAFSLLSPGMALLWVLTGQLAGGAMLGIVFVQSHNGMEIYNDDKDFYSAQIVSTRDVKQNLFNDWFTGGLNRQIEHHLFPTMPRHHLRAASAMVEALCDKHRLAYEDVDMVTGTRLVMRHLAKVAASA